MHRSIAVVLLTACASSMDPGDASVPLVDEQDWNDDGGWEVRAYARDGVWIQEQNLDADDDPEWRLRIHGWPVLSRQEVDEGADGTIDQILRGDYDADGRLLAWEIDNGADGSWDSATYYRYDPDGSCH